MKSKTPQAAGFRMPAEWTPHVATWLAWPSHADLWGDQLNGAHKAVAELAARIAEGERVEMLVPDETWELRAARALRSPSPASPAGVRFHRVPFGDIWLRDTGPLFLRGPQGKVGSVRFAFNGWGGKYVLEHDAQVSERISALVPEARRFAMPLVLEGGALEVDGEGTVLTTRQCMLAGNRNDGLSTTEIERELEQALGCSKVLWLDKGLANDHTDGHVDTLVRFVRPGVVVAMEPRTADDPNAAVLRDVLRDASVMVDAQGRHVEVVRIPSPGCITQEQNVMTDGSSQRRDTRVLPASYVNFYIANACVIVPTYDSPFDEEAVARIGSLFPGRRAVGVDSRALLTGGGAIHCITQQQCAASGGP